MRWSNAQSWIGAMNAANYLGYNDWRLPTSNISTGNISEMSHLLTEFGGGVWGQPLSTTHNANYDLFQNVQGVYWSGESAWNNADYAMAIDFYYAIGLESIEPKDANEYVMAVRTGQGGEVPVPAAAWLMGSGLLGLIGVARRKK